MAFVGLEFIERFYDGLSEYGWVYDTGWVMLLYGKELYECKCLVYEAERCASGLDLFHLSGAFFLSANSTSQYGQSPLLFVQFYSSPNLNGFFERCGTFSQDILAQGF